MSQVERDLPVSNSSDFSPPAKTSQRRLVGLTAPQHASQGYGCLSQWEDQAPSCIAPPKCSFSLPEVDTAVNGAWYLKGFTEPDVQGSLLLEGNSGHLLLTPE